MKNIKLSRRLAIGFTLVLILSTLAAMVGIMYMGEIAQSTERLFKEPYAIHTSALGIQQNIIAMDREMKDVIRVFGHELIARHTQVIDTYEQEILEEFELLYDRFTGDTLVLDNALGLITEWKFIRDEIIEFQRNNQMFDAVILNNESSNPQVALIEAAIDEVVQAARESALHFNTIAQRDAEDARSMLLGILIVAYAVSIITIVFVTKSITKPVERLVSLAQEIAKGNLSVEDATLTNRDEIGALAQALDAMRMSLMKMVSSVTESLETLTNSADQMSIDANLTSHSVEDLAISANQFASAVEQLSSTTEDMSHSARRTNG